MPAASAGPSRRFVLTAPPPVRALAIAAATAVLALILLVVAQATNAPALTVVAAAVLVLALTLAVGAVLLTRRLRTTLVLDDDALHVSRAGQQTSVTWSEVTEAGVDRGRLIFSTSTGEQTTVVLPRGKRDPQFAALHASLRTQLNDSRGYGGPAFGDPASETRPVEDPAQTT